MIFFYRLLATIIIILSVFTINAQNQYCETFNNDFSENWTNTDDWTITLDGIDHQPSLIHNIQNSKGTSTIIYTPNVELNLEENDVMLSFKIQNGNWDPSSSNNFYFSIGSKNGFVVGVNAKGSSDLVSIWDYTDEQVGSKLTETSVDWEKNTTGMITLRITQNGVIDMYVNTDFQSDSIHYKSDKRIPFIDECSFCFEYTKTRAGTLLIDDLCIEEVNAPPSIVNLEQTNNHGLIVHFSEAINQHSIQNTNIDIRDDAGTLFTISKIFWRSNTMLEIETEQALQGLYTCTINNFSDYDGVTCDSSTLTILMRTIITPGEILINEVLFNPFPDGEDFIELINLTGQEIYLGDIEFVSVNEEQDTTFSTPTELIDAFIAPSEVLALSTNIDHLISTYLGCSEWMLEVSRLPKMNNASGHIALIDHNGTTIDRLIYTELMHDMLISDVEGISLERVDSSWHSASERVGGATPGCPNSQQPIVQTEVQITFSSKVISPNYDGHNDALEISIETPQKGYVVNIDLFTVDGRHLKTIENNTLLTSSECITFNGTDKNNKALPIGNYIITISIHHSSGDKHISKHLVYVTDSKN